jgi:hypothetical protein
MEFDTIASNVGLTCGEIRMAIKPLESEHVGRRPDQTMLVERLTISAYRTDGRV